jgi:L-rhamnose-H+ transport protein
MHKQSLAAIGLTILAGAFSGTALLPMKYTPLWRFENTWAIFSIFAYLISPWLVALMTVSHSFQVYADVGVRVCLIVALFGLGWGVAVVLNGVGVALVGLSLSSAILMGSSVAIGSLGALLLRGAAEINTSAAKQILVADGVMLVGVLLCALAGHWRGRDRDGSDNQPQRVTSLGILVCLIAGLLSTLLNIALSFGDVITKAALAHGTNEFNASNAVWSLAVSAGAAPSLIWCIITLTRRRLWHLFAYRQAPSYFLLCISMAVMWITGTVLYGASANMLGQLGPAIGWPIYMSGIILISSFWGWATGEWRGARMRPVAAMMSGLLIQIIAMKLLSQQS